MNPSELILLFRSTVIEAVGALVSDNDLSVDSAEIARKFNDTYQGRLLLLVDQMRKASDEANFLGSKKPTDLMLYAAKTEFKHQCIQNRRCIFVSEIKTKTK